jgi:hypothetical protein
MSRYATLALLVFIVASARAQSHDARKNVVQRYVRWRGGSAFHALRTIHLTARCDERWACRNQTGVKSTFAQGAGTATILFGFIGSK